MRMSARDIFDKPVMLQIRRKFVFEFPSPDRSSSSSITKGVTGLNHELGDYTMEDDAFEIATARMSDKIFHRFWSFRRKQTKVHITERRMDGGRAGEGRRPCGNSGGGGNALFFPCGPLVENVAISRFVVSVME